MELKDRIAKVLEYSGKNISEFSRHVGFRTPQAIRELLKGNTKTLSESAEIKILTAYPAINRAWLLCGEGEMVNWWEEDTTRRAFDKNDGDETPRDTTPADVKLIPLINLDSVGGVHSENQITLSEHYVERMIPFPNARPDDIAILQSGKSMLPTIPPGAILQIRRVEGWREYFGYGGEFVLWLNDDRRITKQVLRYDPDPQNYVLCHSYNPDFADEELPKSMIVEVWKVVNVLIHNGW